MAELPPRVQGFLANNETWSKKLQPFPTMKELRRAAFSGERKGILILTCLDPRCVPEQYFGPNIGAAVIRNAGGRANDDVVKSVLLLRSLADADVLLVVHHTDCGVMHLTQRQIVEEAKKRTPQAADRIVSLGDYGCFTEKELEQSIKEDVLKLRAEKALEGVQVIGFTMDLNDGIVRQVNV
ncbi:uncharacterized protein RCC_11141 [Ramularia collo-cygni]|uniref:Carbonic anhydrase n=1 Tax=Ramularia collo-cygni TaxID=112498 RepID=A0A2D3VE62_9PEZI|nr:uncharacterized protein RCC_11141 [Ramularia collo-cygni]CZT25410.1 uncharacterized protein RCC_11141 [Ramularia collo-cygni]